LLVANSLSPLLEGIFFSLDISCLTIASPEHNHNKQQLQWRWDNSAGFASHIIRQALAESKLIPQARSSAESLHRPLRCRKRLTQLSIALAREEMRMNQARNWYVGAVTAIDYGHGQDASLNRRKTDPVESIVTTSPQA
jgi:hypothetical protein